MSDAPCAFCDRKATKLCDGILAWLGDGNGRYASNARKFTCDLNLCDAHAHRAGAFHFNMKPQHRFDTIDYCPRCLKEGLTFEAKPVFVDSIQEGEAMVRRRAFGIALRPLSNPVKEMLL